MRTFIFAVLLVLPWEGANAQMIYRCPQVYPGNDASAAPLTGAFMDAGETVGVRSYAPPRVEAAEEGYDMPYSFADEEQAWLVCSYGGSERTQGRFHDGHEWNQRMEGSIAEWWVKVAPRIGVCTVQVREVKSRDPKKATWTSTATCAKP